MCFTFWLSKLGIKEDKDILLEIMASVFLVNWRFAIFTLEKLLHLTTTIFIPAADRVQEFTVKILHFSVFLSVSVYVLVTDSRRRSPRIRMRQKVKIETCSKPRSIGLKCQCVLILTIKDGVLGVVKTLFNRYGWKTRSIFILLSEIIRFFLSRRS